MEAGRLGTGSDHEFHEILRACRHPPLPALLRNDLAHEREGARRLDRLCSLLIATALRRSGIFVDGNRLWSIEAICEHMSVRFARRAHIQRLIDILHEDNWVRGEWGGYRWRGVPLPDYTQIVAEATQLEVDYPFASGAAGLLLRCVAAMPQVIAGKESAVAVMFANGSVTELEVFYSRFPLLALANAMAASAVSRIAGLRHGAALDVLEVGAGTGALTAALLPALGDRVDRYVYSDVSSSFLAHARRKFPTCSALRTRLLDIDKDPVAQSMEEEQFDLVVGSNVVHATPDVRRSIRHLRRTLRAGGHLVMVETVAPSRFADCTVGLFDGWWSFRDSALRDDYPLLSMWQWQELLREEGFRVAAVPVGEQAEPETSVALLIATKLDVQAEQAFPLRSAV